MAQLCTECGAAIEPGMKFCVKCGAKAEAAEPVTLTTDPAPAPAQPPPEAPDAAPARAEAVKPIGFFWCLWHLFLLNIPVLGLVLSFVWGLRTKPRNRSSLARAMIFINIIWLAVAIMFCISAYSVLHQTGYSIHIFGVSLRF